MDSSVQRHDCTETSTALVLSKHDIVLITTKKESFNIQLM